MYISKHLTVLGVNFCQELNQALLLLRSCPTICYDRSTTAATALPPAAKQVPNGIPVQLVQ